MALVSDRIVAEYEKIVRHSAPGVITGKPLTIGGSLGRGDATAKGGMYVLMEGAKYIERLYSVGLIEKYMGSSVKRTQAKLKKTNEVHKPHLI